jgi:hypothetical protein
MIEVREVLRLRGEGLPNKRIAAGRTSGAEGLRRSHKANQIAARVRMTCCIAHSTATYYANLHRFTRRNIGDGHMRGSPYFWGPLPSAVSFREFPEAARIFHGAPRMVTADRPKYEGKLHALLGASRFIAD